MSGSQFANLTFFYRTTAFIACIGLTIASLEYLAVSREFRTNGMFAWRVMGSRPVVARHRKIFSFSQPLLEQHGFVILIAIRLLAGVTLPWVLAYRPAAFLLILLIVGISLLISFRNFVGSDGSDQMSIIIFVSLLLYVATNDRIVQYVAVGFLGAQCMLSYVVAGIAKATSPAWRKGNALKGIFRTETYGAALVVNTLYLLPDYANRLLCWTVIVLESTFFVTAFAPFWFCIILLALAAAFHVFNAFAMGLNTFLWSFAAGYPAIIILNHLVVG